jgi:hypothetical protein
MGSEAPKTDRILSVRVTGVPHHRQAICSRGSQIHVLKRRIWRSYDFVKQVNGIASVVPIIKPQKPPHPAPSPVVSI